MEQSEWEDVVTHLEKMLQTVKFGSITLVVQDGKVIQIEKNEKVRLQKNK
ncbi:YezD family protein [Bacillus sp. LL01]|nr:YezD family protein [Bacillus sp. LL01]